MSQYKFKKMISEEEFGLQSGKEDALIEMMDCLATMKVECDSLYHKIDNYLEFGEIPVNHDLELPEEFMGAYNKYQELTEDMY